MLTNTKVRYGLIILAIIALGVIGVMALQQSSGAREPESGDAQAAAGTGPAQTAATPAGPEDGEPGATPSTIETEATEMPQVIEEEYGQLPRSGQYTFFVPPAISPTLSLTEQRKQLTAILEARDKRAQELYEKPHYVVAYEFANPTFVEVFPEARMYAVVTNADSTADTTSYTTMVSLGEKDYRMPQDFNQLMIDAGYSLNEDTRDALGRAFIVAGMPTEMAAQPVRCSPGKEINKTITSVKLVYEIECVVAYQDIGAVTVLFFPFDDLFRSVSIGWGTLHESGWRNQGFQFGSRGIEP